MLLLSVVFIDAFYVWLLFLYVYIVHWTHAGVLPKVYIVVVVAVTTDGIFLMGAGAQLVYSCMQFSFIIQYMLI